MYMLYMYNMCNMYNMYNMYITYMYRCSTCLLRSTNTWKERPGRSRLAQYILALLFVLCCLYGLLTLLASFCFPSVSLINTYIHVYTLSLLQCPDLVLMCTGIYIHVYIIIYIYIYIYEFTLLLYACHKINY